MIESIILAIVVATIGAIGAAVQRYLKVKLTPEQYNVALDLTRTAVLGAEKFAEATNIKGRDKYEYAEAAITAGAKKVGLNLPPEVVNSFIHSVLAELQGVGNANETVPAAEVQRLVDERDTLIHDLQTQVRQLTPPVEAANVTPINPS